MPYAMSGTEMGYAATRCPVLRWAMLLRDVRVAHGVRSDAGGYHATRMLCDVRLLSAAYAAMTDIGYGFAMCGTEVAYGAMRCAYYVIVWCYEVCSTKLAYGATRNSRIARMARTTPLVCSYQRGPALLRAVSALRAGTQAQQYQGCRRRYLSLYAYITALLSYAYASTRMLGLRAGTQAQQYQYSRLSTSPPTLWRPHAMKLPYDIILSYRPTRVSYRPTHVLCDERYWHGGSRPSISPRGRGARSQY
eukprot:3940808-Rhodomonas_salina.12